MALTEKNTPPESPAARYRRRAEELRAMAREVQSIGLQTEFLLLAHQYEKLAEHPRALDRWR